MIRMLNGRLLQKWVKVRHPKGKSRPLSGNPKPDRVCRKGELAYRMQVWIGPTEKILESRFV
jgi:hypothetical protein